MAFFDPSAAGKSGTTPECVVSGLVLDHNPDSTAFFAQLARLWRPGGRVVVSVMHPAMRLRVPAPPPAPPASSSSPGAVC